jgi:sulfur-oxidizing protein SoxB
MPATRLYHPYSIWVALLLSLCFPLVARAATVEADKVTFIHFNDLHANLIPHRDLVRTQADAGPAIASVETRGGLARIATLVKQIRAKFPNSILMNIGDTYHGGAEAIYTRGNAIVAPVNELNIDIGVPGNWDFAYGPVTTRLRYADDDSTLWRLANSIMFDDEVESPTYPLLPATRILQVGNRRIGFIGITSDIIPRMSPMLAWGFEFLKGEEAYRSYVDTHARALRDAGVDLVVVMSELGLHKDRQLANVVAPGVDVFFSAHTHELTPRPIISSSGALVVEAGNDGVIGTMTVAFDDTEHPLFSWNTIAVDETIDEDPQMAALVAQARAPFLVARPGMNYPMPRSTLHLSEPIDTVIGPSPLFLHRRHALENPFNSYLAERMRKHFASDVAITPGFRFDAVVPTGVPMTLEESYRYLPAPPTLARGMMTAARLRALLEQELTRVFSHDAFSHNGGWMMGISGIELSLDLDCEDGHKILEMQRTADGSVLSGEEQLSVVSCLRPFDADDELCGNGGFSDIQGLQSPDGNENWTPVEFLRWSLNNEQQAIAPAASIRDSSGTRFWPETHFVQPLK